MYLCIWLHESGQDRGHEPHGTYVYIYMHVNMCVRSYIYVYRCLCMKVWVYISMCMYDKRSGSWVTWKVGGGIYIPIRLFQLWSSANIVITKIIIIISDTYVIFGWKILFIASLLWLNSIEVDIIITHVRIPLPSGLRIVVSRFTYPFINISLQKYTHTIIHLCIHKHTCIHLPLRIWES